MTFSNSQTQLKDLLNYSRPHGGKCEKAFTKRFIDNLPGVRKDGFGNAWVEILGNGDDVLWSCHVDTITNFDGLQKVKIDELGIARLDLPYVAPVVPIIEPLTTGLPLIKYPFQKSPHWGRVLGGDDSAGVFLMREMILAGKPGGYVFHRGEECGGLGSAYIRDHEPDLLKPYCAAIALDRAGYTSVITSQFEGETASIAFANSLSKALAEAGMEGYKPDPTGIFTDTANYMYIIPECSNLSVGYAKAHTPDETLDTRFVMRLRDALLSLDLSRLNILRDPMESFYAIPTDPIISGWDREELIDQIRRNPHAAAQVLQDYGLEDSFLDAIYYKGQ